MFTSGGLPTRLAALALAALAGCGSGKGDPVDAAVDLCADVTCPGLTSCDQGLCVPYPACPVVAWTPDPDPTPMCDPGTVCRNHVCVPSDADVDGDSHPAATDCDEQNPDIHPGAPDVCNAIDDDCSGTADDAAPEVLCSGDQAGNVCVTGSCVCANGNFELDPMVPGCECAAAPVLGEGVSCESAIDVGELPDLGLGRNVMGNIPNGRQLWYRFRGVDSRDTSCDNFHVTAKLVDNPGEQFRIRMSRGACGPPPGQFTIVEWATDLRATINGQLTGQCPCWSGTPVNNVSPCTDDSAEFFIVVERVTDGADTCAAFNLELSNGLYDWQ